ncbi:MAG: FAD-binding protein [Dorea sp.]|nr:FAD-binding protein [Dorea sp.]
MDINADVVIVGTGVGGLFAALNLPEDIRVVMLTKLDAKSSDSFLAQGGICVLRDDEDYDAYFEDTMRAGHYENRKESVDIMLRGSRDVIHDLVKFGVEFAKEDGGFIYTREGAHSRPRILFHEDITGQEITGKLLERAKERANITILEYTEMTDIIERNGVCCGVAARKRVRAEEQILEQQDAGGCTETRGQKDARDRSGTEWRGSADDEFRILARDTVLATGGIGGRYKHSTNYPHLTGDAVEIARRHKIRLENLDYVQFHPTTLYSKKPGRRFLISESVRGEGAVLYNKKKERFVNELLPRDVVAKAIRRQMEEDETDYVWLSMEHIDKEKILKHFPHIYERCLEEGYDVTRECIPVVPAQHYFMGGIWVDSDSKSSMENLYAVGETSCNGVHGANRLASNSLLESLVFAKRAAKKIKKDREIREE